MHRLLVWSLLSLSPTLLPAEEPPEQLVKADFEPFTGSVSKRGVRLRTGPSVETAIARDLQRGELLVVDGERDGFYRVRPPTDLKAYVFRSFILDGEIEGTGVNVRLMPDLDAPVVTQLNTGDTAHGIIAEQNCKWLEIEPPEGVHFWVSEDFVERVGDEHYLALVESRKQEAVRLLDLAINRGQEELQKSFNQIEIEPVLAITEQLISQYSEFEEQASRAGELKKQLSDDYLQLKVAYLEEKASEAQKVAEAQKWWSDKSESFAYAPKQEREEMQISQSGRLDFWKQIEQRYLDHYRTSVPDADIESFYAMQKEKSHKLHGVIEPYLRPVKNKPGDYLLVNPTDQKPIAYLYSTEVNLQNSIGDEIDLVVIERPNNHFSYPAYYVLDVTSE